MVYTKIAHSFWLIRRAPAQFVFYILKTFLVLYMSFLAIEMKAQYKFEEQKIKTDSSVISIQKSISDQDTSVMIVNRLKKSDTAYLTDYYQNSDIVMRKGKFIEEVDNQIGKWYFYRPDGKHIKTLNYTTGKVEFWADDSLDLKAKFNRSVDVADSTLKVFMCEDFVDNNIHIWGTLSLTFLDGLAADDRKILDRGWALSYNVLLEGFDTRHTIDVTIGSNNRIESINKIPFFDEGRCEVQSKEVLDKIAKRHGVRNKRNVLHRIEKVAIEDTSGIPLMDEIRIKPVRLEISYLKPKKETRTLESRRSFRDQQKYLQVTLCPYTSDVLKIEETWVTTTRGTKVDYFTE